MLKRVQRGKRTTTGGRYAIIASQYNRRYVDGMVREAQRGLREAGAALVDVVRVPGAFEIPVVAGFLARRTERGYDALICLGVILRGATAHAQHLGEAVSHALAQVQVQFGKPVVHEVLLLDDEAQARERCLSGRYNRGLEAAHTALAMGELMRRLLADASAVRPPLHRRSE